MIPTGGDYKIVTEPIENNMEGENQPNNNEESKSVTN